jgi:hypothetical protein
MLDEKCLVALNDISFIIRHQLPYRYAGHAVVAFTRQLNYANLSICFSATGKKKFYLQ